MGIQPVVLMAATTQTSHGLPTKVSIERMWLQVYHRSYPSWLTIRAIRPITDLCTHSRTQILHERAIEGWIL